MTLHDYIARLKKSNPHLFAAKEIKMTPSALIEQIEAAYNAGEAHGKSGSLFDELFPPLKKP